MFATVGSGGAALLIILALVLHKRGGGRLKPVKDHHLVYWGFALGLLATGISDSLGRAIDHSVQSVHVSGAGVVGPGVAAVALILIAFGTKPGFTKDLICGVAAPSVFAFSGIDLLTSVITMVSSVVHSAVS